MAFIFGVFNDAVSNIVRYLTSSGGVINEFVRPRPGLLYCSGIYLEGLGKTTNTLRTARSSGLN